MPTIEDYTRLRRMGEFQQELGEILKAQGSFISSQGNALLDKEEDEMDEEKKEGKKKGIPKSIKASIITRLRKRRNKQGEVKDTRVDGPNLDFEFPGSYFAPFEATR